LWTTTGVYLGDFVISRSGGLLFPGGMVTLKYLGE